MAITTRLPDKNPTINLLLRKIINITINYKWFYIASLYRIHSAQLFLSGVGKTNVKTRKKIVEYAQARARYEKIIYCKHKLYSS